MSIQQTILNDRVRYSPELGVWTLDMGSRSAEAMQSSTHIFIAAMHYAREAGNLPECACWPEGVNIAPMTMHVEWATTAKVHKVHSQGGFSVLGHGPVPGNDSVSEPEKLNRAACPLANPEGEKRAIELVRTNLTELWELTHPFPRTETVILQPSDATKAPKVWTGDPIDIGRGRTVPGRHVPAAVRQAAEAVAFVNGEADAARKLATEAKLAADDAPAAASAAVRKAAANGERMTQEAAGAIIRERQDAAQAAEAVAAGMAQAADDARRSILDSIETNRAEWLAYLHEHAAHNLARLDAALSEVDASLSELADIDRVRQTVQKPNASRLFGEASFIGTAGGNAMADLRNARTKAAADLGSLARHASPPTT